MISKANFEKPLSEFTNSCEKIYYKNKKQEIDQASFLRGYRRWKEKEKHFGQLSPLYCPCFNKK